MKNKKRYDKTSGQRVTNCCGVYSTYHGDDLCCKVCWNLVEIGEGDGNEWHPDVTPPA